MKILYFTLGVLIPLPLFYNILGGEFLFQQATEDYYVYEFGVPVPIGLFSFCFLWLILLARRKYYINLKKMSRERVMSFLSLIGFVLYGIYSLDFFRLVSLILPIFLLLFALHFKSDFVVSISALHGYAVSVFLLIISHALSILFFVGINGSNKDFGFNTYFNYVIYQALVSYSAVLSFIGCATILFLIRSYSVAIKIILVIFIFAIYFILSHGARKAVLIDLLILICCFIFYSLISVLSVFKLSKKYLYTIFFLLIGFFVLMVFTGFSERDITVEAAVDQRGGAYDVFWEQFASASIVSLLFGFRSEWGGFSNIMLEFVASLGLIGLMLYTFVGYRYFKNIFYSHSGIPRAMSDHWVANKQSTQIFVVFAVCSVIFSNLVNMNLQLPYYTLNLIFVIFFFTLVHNSKKRN